MRHGARSYIDRLARRAGVAALYHSPVGVKQTNQLFKSPMFDAYVTGERRVAEPGDLRLGVDALRDEYTLLETTIAASPHLSLMRTLADPCSEPAPVYLDRVAAGTLDWRPPRRVSPALVELLRTRHTKRLDEIRRGEPIVVRVAWRDDQAYLVDGKHRAAMAHLDGLTVECETVSGVFQDSYFQWIRSVMSRRPQVYGAHLRFWEHLQHELEAARKRT